MMVNTNLHRIVRSSRFFAQRTNRDGKKKREKEKKRGRKGEKREKIKKRNNLSAVLRFIE